MSLDELRKEAQDLGIKFQANIGEEKLKQKIDEYYESQESSGKEIEEAIEKKAEEKSEEKTVSTSKESFRVKAKKMEENARKTRVITIVDNDQRINNHTTCVPVNCSNEYFDLGTVVLPLGTPVEVAQGHINVLKEVEIPQHMKNPRSGLSTVTIRNRYSISYEDK